MYSTVGGGFLITALGGLALFLLSVVPSRTTSPLESIPDVGAGGTALGSLLASASGVIGGGGVVSDRTSGKPMGGGDGVLNPGSSSSALG
jgi:hypothetical protein